MKIILLSLLLLSPSFAEVYVTESKVQVDRCACAWFIVRFLDPEAEFLFFEHGTEPPEGIGFDFYGADYFHKGADCSFTAFIKKHPTKDKKEQDALIQINALVNDVFAWRDGPSAPSAELRRKIDAIWKESGNDLETIKRTFVVFDRMFKTKK